MTQDTVITSAISRILYAPGPTIMNSHNIVPIWNSIVENAAFFTSLPASRDKIVSTCVAKLVEQLSTGVRSTHLTVVEMRTSFDAKRVGWNFEFVSCYPLGSRIAVANISFYIDRKGVLYYSKVDPDNTDIVWTRHAAERVYSRFMPVSDHGSPGLLVQAIKDMSNDAVYFNGKYGHLTRERGLNIIPVCRGHFTTEKTDGSLFLTTYIEEGLYLDGQEYLAEINKILQPGREAIVNGYDKYLDRKYSIRICKKKLKAQQIDIFKPNQMGLYHAVRRTRSTTQTVG